MILGCQPVAATRSPGPHVDICVNHWIERRNDPCTIDESLQDTPPPSTPARHLCAETHLSYNREGQDPGHRLQYWSPPSLTLRATNTQPGARDHRVDDNRNSLRSGLLEDGEELVLFLGPHVPDHEA